MKADQIIILGNRLLILLVILSFVLFAKTLLHWVPMNTWMIIFVVGIVVCGALEIVMRYKAGMKPRSQN